MTTAAYNAWLTLIQPAVFSHRLDPDKVEMLFAARSDSGVAVFVLSSEKDTIYSLPTDFETVATIGCTLFDMRYGMCEPHTTRANRYVEVFRNCEK